MFKKLMYMYLPLPLHEEDDTGSIFKQSLTDWNSVFLFLDQLLYQS